MSRSAELIYRKTAAGQAELMQRQAGLGPRERALLVMVNGQEPVQRLVDRLGERVLDTLSLLRQRGLIEPVAAERPARTPPPPPRPAEPPPVAAGLDPQRHRQAAQALVALLLPYFGPDAPRIADKALRARSPQEFNDGVTAVAERLAIHLGRRRAAEATDPLRW
ncbi:hypothetical protein KAK07_12340 [Ideonella sp. 4Y16]|uniref:Uncharacterized protein n=1 Tax=Ideonella alba TaxID=2824118 RepID=A0A940YFT8_9BURK|nr:hypothetical protein [Ideonella alba]MBQ0931685.1 hypothetical protein [Ideonella alba]MBQ0944124.1 hypothetical protein [Ideonella alba]